jgi:hypothetical protein
MAGLVALCMLGCTIRLYAQATNWPEIHSKDDALWVRRSGLTLQEVRRLRHLAGVVDESTDMIDNIDTSAQHGLVVFATHGGTAGCVVFRVFSRSNGDLKQLWSLEEAGDEANFCADPKCSIPIVRLQKNLNIEVEIPSFRIGHCAVHSVGLFKWNGSGYIYEGIVNKSVADKSK